MNLDETTAPTTQTAPNRRAALVRLAVVCTFLIFAACMSILVYRGTSIEVPDCVLIVRASKAWDGSVMSVDGYRLVRPTQVKVDRGTKYTISFHLMPGEYTLTALREGNVIFTEKVLLTRASKSDVVYLPKSPDDLTPTTQPSWPFQLELPWSRSTMPPVIPSAD